MEPNFRGSTGFGPAFLHMADNDGGGGDLQDVVYAAKFLVSTGYVDPKRIGITGSSYGGFLTLMAIGKTPDVWAAAASWFGNLGLARQTLRNARAPLLVLHGDNDPRVPKADSLTAVSILQAAGKMVEAHYYPDEGHGFVRRENQIDATRRTVAWFDRYLKKERTANSERETDDGRLVILSRPSERQRAQDGEGSSH
jgi:dipeptidyl aminopeptidase/acylaminoacyl peptidase